MANSERPHLLALPPEIREHIYRLSLHPDANRVQHPNEYTDYDYRNAFALFKINRLIYYEARKVFRDLNIFVRIETPWRQAKDQVAVEGHVPILMKEPRAAKFREHSMSVVIGAPESFLQGPETDVFIILVDDLDKFTRTWYYSDLSHPGMNSILRLKLQLRDPYTPSWDEKRIPKWKQQRLLTPFQMVKGLGEMVVEGDPKPFASLEKELREAQSVPHPRPEHCLRETIRLKAEGNTELNNGNVQQALKIYARAWEAMHIVVKGRQRHIHGNEYFERTLVEPPFKGKSGQAERLLLRVQLVANTTLAYLKLEEYEEAKFWGERTINMLRQAMGIDDHTELPAEEEAVLGFPAFAEMGKIYYRTALACKALGDTSSARKLLRVAKVYLPNDKSVAKEVAACALQLG